MTPDEFRELYKRESRALLGSYPDDNKINDSYEDYKNLVDLTGCDGDVIFSKKRGKLIIDFKPIV